MNLTPEEKRYLVALCSGDILGYQVINSLHTQYQSFKKIYETPPSDWKNVSENIKNKWIKQKELSSIDKTYQELELANTKVITFYDQEYPELLRQIPSPPIILYYQGDISLLNSVSLGVVGTRIISPYGQQAIEFFIPPLVAAGLTIASGFQKGVDQAAHKETLKSKGKTVAILGTGIDIAYPTHSEKLRSEIINSGGVMLSEYPLGTEPFKQNFPRRNRIISGLSKGVLVVEAAQQSGSLITAKFANEQNRDVFAIPGSIFSNLSHGPHFLIQQGAKCVHTPEDILTELQILPQGTVNAELSNLSELQQKIVEQIRNSPVTIDQLALKINKPINELSAEITIMELEGIIKDMGDGTYIIKK